MILLLFVLIALAATFVRTIAAIRREKRARQFILDRIYDVQTKNFGDRKTRAEQYLQPAIVYEICHEQLKMPDKQLGALCAQHGHPKDTDAVVYDDDYQVSPKLLATYFAVVNVLRPNQANVVYGHVMVGHGSVRHSVPYVWLEFDYDAARWVLIDLEGNILSAKRFYSDGTTVRSKVNLEEIQECYQHY